MKKILLKLINNERTNPKVTSAKGCDAPITVDLCQYIDQAACSTNAVDQCYKDYAGCHNYAGDACYIDYTSCSGPEVRDLVG